MLIEVDGDHEVRRIITSAVVVHLAAGVTVTLQSAAEGVNVLPHGGQFAILPRPDGTLTLKPVEEGSWRSNSRPVPA